MMAFTDDDPYSVVIDTIAAADTRVQAAEIMNNLVLVIHDHVPGAIDLIPVMKSISTAWGTHLSYPFQHCVACSCTAMYTAHVFERNGHPSSLRDWPKLAGIRQWQFIPQQLPETILYACALCWHFAKTMCTCKKVRYCCENHQTQDAPRHKRLCETSLPEPRLLWSSPFTALRACGHCGRAARKKCGSCYRQRYCNRSCQRSNWWQHRGHCRLTQNVPVPVSQSSLSSSPSRYWSLPSPRPSFSLRSRASGIHRHACGHCGRGASKRCGGCFRQYYCSKSCQHSDWSWSGHRKECA